MGNKYAKNYISKVIVRIDFLNSLVALNDDIPSKLSSACKQNFPIPEPKEIPLHELHIGPAVQNLTSVEEERKTIREWHFYGPDRTRHLTITQFFMHIEYTRYGTFEDFEASFTSIVDALYDTYNELQIKRFGLRYINNIELAGENRFSWSAYLNRNLLSILNVPRDKSNIIRAFQNLELKLGDCILRFQFGMHNPDYPSPIKKKSFILDYDAYIVGLLTKAEINRNLEILHDEIEKMFELSITEKLRGMMNVSG
ncbi:MAG: hypothetical protein BWX58_00089 [Deltaproteobacteria bacterium ADurb.Bin026]|jgi:uncharacterized protein (TIGR04255 family)|nr:TIGR04255 family protein [Candidatus Omnitrophota bacterium]OQC52877.1 MAG: hypothetical protein BWX58_00089 [Deltaproteobacteria bacterium ADurb.Bin026]HOX15997.1 TIGR04255 family protein [Smithellaceae bacterium]